LFRRFVRGTHTHTHSCCCCCCCCCCCDLVIILLPPPYIPTTKISGRSSSMTCHRARQPIQWMQQRQKQYVKPPSIPTCVCVCRLTMTGHRSDTHTHTHSRSHLKITKQTHATNGRKTHWLCVAFFCVASSSSFPFFPVSFGLSPG
jgi:hypothetical protein